MISRSILLLFCSALTVIIACDKIRNPFSGREQVSVDLDTTVTFPSEGTFTLEAANCNMNIKAGAEGVAIFNIKKIVRAPSAEAAETHLADMKLRIFPMGRGYKCDIKVPVISKVSYYAEMDIHLPPSAKLNLNSLYGNVDISGFRSEINMKHVSGEINIENCKGACNITSLNGFIFVDNMYPNDLRSSFQTSNGEIKLILHEGTNAYFNATSLNGTIDLDKEMPLVNPLITGRAVSGMLGTGATQIKVNTQNASIKLIWKKTKTGLFD